MAPKAIFRNETFHFFRTEGQNKNLIFLIVLYLQVWRFAFNRTKQKTLRPALSDYFAHYSEQGFPLIGVKISLKKNCNYFLLSMRRIHFYCTHIWRWRISQYPINPLQILQTQIISLDNSVINMSSIRVQQFRIKNINH